MSALVIVRDIHFVSSVIVAGVVFFDLLVASPVLRSDLRFSKAQYFFREAARQDFLDQPRIVDGISGYVAMSAVDADHGQFFGNVIGDAIVWTVLSQTRFGFAWEMRLLFGVPLGACLLFCSRTRGWAHLAHGRGQYAGRSLLGALAFAGHGQEGAGLAHIHLAADFLHLDAAGYGSVRWSRSLCCSSLCDTSLRRAGCPRLLPQRVAFHPRHSRGRHFASQRNHRRRRSARRDRDFVDTGYGRLLLLK